MTLTKLADKRKREFVPDPSYDLDGDGLVGPSDFVMAKQFDKDGDGKLNAKERAQAIAALKNGYENNFMWGLEKRGPDRKYRCFQIRGKIVDGEDFSDVKDTYPAYPPSKIKPKYETRTEMIAKKQQDHFNSMAKKHGAWQESNPPAAVQTWKISEFLVEKPNYRTKTEIDQAWKQTKREEGGLEREWKDLDKQKAPSLQFCSSPKFKTKKEMEQAKKQQDMQSLQTMFGYAAHQTKEDRINERDDAQFRLNYMEDQRYSQTLIKERRKQDGINYNLNTFAHHAVGVHGHELPKFSHESDKKEYWKLKSNYRSNPNHQSLKQFKQEQKFWAKDDQQVIADTKDELPRDPLRSQEFFPIKHKKEFPDKVSSINHYLNPDFKPHEVKAAMLSNTKWSNEEANVRKGKNAIIASTVSASEQSGRRNISVDYSPYGQRTTEQGKQRVLQANTGGMLGKSASMMLQKPMIQQRNIQLDSSFTSVEHLHNSAVRGPMLLKAGAGSPMNSSRASLKKFRTGGI